jgi:hypothetical protein
MGSPFKDIFLIVNPRLTKVKYIQKKRVLPKGLQNGCDKEGKHLHHVFYYGGFISITSFYLYTLRPKFQGVKAYREMIEKKQLLSAIHGEVTYNIF